MFYLAPIPKQFVDSSGVPYSDGTVEVFLHNDTKRGEIYLDAEGTALAPNPAKLDSHGAWIGYVPADVEYDYVIKDKNRNVVFSFSNVVAVGGGGSGEGIKVFAVRYSTDTGDYIYPTYTELSSAVSAGKMPVILQYVYNSPLRYCFVFRWLSGGYIRFDNNSRYIEISNSNTANWGYINDKNLAADYDPTAIYDAGDYCVYHNELFVCTTDITVAEEWNGSHWQRTSMSDIVGNVEALLSAL